MRAVVTRVKSASVTIDGRVNGEIGQGLLVLLGVGPSDTEAQAVKLADKVCGLRIFEDENEKMNLNLEAVGGALLVVSQFTLYADTKSRRPGFTGAAKPPVAIPLYEKFMAECAGRGFRVEHGEFGADMQVYSQNDGPVTPRPRFFFFTQNTAYVLACGEWRAVVGCCGYAGVLAERRAGDHSAGHRPDVGPNSPPRPRRVRAFWRSQNLDAGADSLRPGR